MKTTGVSNIKQFGLLGFLGHPNLQDHSLYPHSCGEVTVMYEGAGGKMEKRVVAVERELEELENRLETTNEGK